MQLNTDPNVIIIYALVFLLGLLVGAFLTAGGRRKWKTRYYDEVTRREQLERDHVAAERDWRERDSLRDAAERDRTRAAALAPAVAATNDPRDVNNDGVVTPGERKTGFVDRMLGRDRDGDGVPDRDDRSPDDSSRA